MNLLINFIVAFLALGLMYVLTSEGLWGSALMFFNVLFAAMVAFNFYEPLARLIDSTQINWGFSDTLCLLGLFCIALVILRMITETIAPVMVRFPVAVYHAGRLVFGLAGAGVAMAVIILAFHCAGAQEDLQRDQPRIQAAVWFGARSFVAGILSVRDGRGVFEHGPR